MSRVLRAMLCGAGRERRPSLRMSHSSSTRSDLRTSVGFGSGALGAVGDGDDLSFGLLLRSVRRHGTRCEIFRGQMMRDDERTL